MGFLRNMLRDRKNETLIQDMHVRASRVTKAFKDVYEEATNGAKFDGDEAQFQSIAKASIEKFLVRVFREATEQENDVPLLDLSEETVRDFVRYVDSSISPSSEVNAGHLVAWAQNMNETVRAGRLVTMPSATVESSRGYRGLLHANAICQKMGWNWESREKSQKDYTDHTLALIVGDLMALTFDKYGLDSEVGFAGRLGSALLHSWNTSEERKELQQ